MTTVAALGLLAGLGLVVTGIRLRGDPRIVDALSALGREGQTAPGGWLATGVGRRLRRLPWRTDQGQEQGERLRAQLAGWRLVTASAGAALGATALASGGPLEVVAAVLLTLGGFRLPDFLLARRSASHRARMEADVPAMLDLLSLSVASGLTPRLALERVSESVVGPLGPELRDARHEVALGSPWREALRGLAARTGLRDIRRLAVTLERSERLGTPVASQLRSLAREVRAERRAEAEERARRAPVLMLFPLVFLILPAFVLAAVVPAVLVAARGLP